jgi:flagellum-specific ATP synthase
VTGDSLLDAYITSVEALPEARWSGRVTQAIGHIVESCGPLASVGDACEIIDSEGNRYPAEIVGFRGRQVLTMPLRHLKGVRYGDRVRSWGARPTIGVTQKLLGRVIDAEGQPLDGLGPLHSTENFELDRCGPPAMERRPIDAALGCGVRAIDGMLTCGLGQRIGIFGGSGVGKSTLIGMMARGTEADLTVVALVGERGREVREFLEDALGPEGRSRSVVVVSTSDQSALLRIRAAMAAATIAEYFCARGKNVLMVLDSVTRMAMAQREIGLAAGEPPTAKGYTPSVFSMLARFVERAGRMQSGSITAFYTVLMEGDDDMDPVVDAVRSLLDGHVVLDRGLTSSGHYPPIDILESLSRLMPAICSEGQIANALRIRELMASYKRSEDLIRIGAYQGGADPSLDNAVRLLPRIQNYLRQASTEKTNLQDAVAGLASLLS